MTDVDVISIQTHVDYKKQKEEKNYSSFQNSQNQQSFVTEKLLSMFHFENQTEHFVGKSQENVNFIHLTSK